MSELGVFAVDRGIFEHPVLDVGAPLSKREAWLWLLAEASWKPRPYNAGGAIVTLQRGQVAHSVRYMAAKWRWPKSNVSRFLSRLRNEGMIRTENGPGVSVITISKYNEYQRVSLPDGTANGTGDGTAVGQQWDSKEDIKTLNKEVLSEKGVSDAPSKPSKRHKYPDDFLAAWKAYPTDRLMSKTKAFAAWQKLSIEDRSEVIAAIPGFVVWCRNDLSYRPVHMVQFIAERRFDGFAAEPEQQITAVGDWQKRLKYARDKSIWSTREWGPMPGLPGCEVQPTLLLPGDGEGWGDVDGKAARA